MQFKVPQFIDMEDKIVGPLTLKQFAYILGAGGFSFLIWTFISIKIIAVILIIPVGGFFLALAFVKINERPFMDTVESAFSYYTNSKIYTWRQPTDSQNNPAENIVVETTKEMAVAKANSNKLHELSLGLDVLDTSEETIDNRKI